MKNLYQYLLKHIDFDQNFIKHMIHINITYLMDGFDQNKNIKITLEEFDQDLEDGYGDVITEDDVNIFRSFPNKQSQ